MPRTGISLKDAQKKLDAATAAYAKGDKTALLDIQRYSAMLARKTPGVADKIKARAREIEQAESKVLAIVGENMIAFAKKLGKVDGELLENLMLRASTGAEKNAATLGKFNLKKSGLRCEIVVKRVKTEEEIGNDDDDDESNS